MSGDSAMAEEGVASANEPVYNIPLRVHLGLSGRSAADFRDILEDINHIWLSQAGICFEIEVVMNDDIVASGFDIWFMPEIEEYEDSNGNYAGRNDIKVRDLPLLKASSTPSKHPAARTAAHELGHGLGLPHRQDSDDNLMRSRTTGWQLNSDEIALARKTAAALAPGMRDGRECGPIRVEPR